MPSAPVTGFISKKEAAERYERSHRQLTRDVRDAIVSQDAQILSHLRLRTDDGRVREGTEVTIEIVKQLRLDGANPAWYFRSSWLEKTFGRRLASGEPFGPADEPPLPERPSLTAADAESQRLIAVYEEIVHDLRQELKIKNQQISDASERQKETNQLTRELHLLLHRTWEQGEQRLILDTPAVDKATATSGGSEPPVTQVSQEGTQAGAPQDALTPVTPTRRKPKPAKSSKATSPASANRLQQLFPTFSSFLRRK